jgi:hypothetical protein
MFIKFKKFINEYHSYSGKYSSVGFKQSNPPHKYKLTLKIKYRPENEEFFKNILNKYTIPFDENETTLTNMDPKGFLKKQPETQLLNLTFFAYNVYEANAIIDTIIKEIVKIRLKFDPNSFDVTPSIDIKMNKEKLIGFNRK